MTSSSVCRPVNFPSNAAASTARCRARDLLAAPAADDSNLKMLASRTSKSRNAERWESESTSGRAMFVKATCEMLRIESNRMQSRWDGFLQEIREKLKNFELDLSQKWQAFELENEQKWAGARRSEQV